MQGEEDQGCDSKSIVRVYKPLRALFLVFVTFLKKKMILAIFPVKVNRYYVSYVCKSYYSFTLIPSNFTGENVPIVWIYFGIFFYEMIFTILMVEVNK